MIASALVEVPGASQVVKGGFVTYQSVSKTMLLGVPAEMIDRYDVVSAEVARAMAQGARERLGVDIAVSATAWPAPTAAPRNARWARCSWGWLRRRASMTFPCILRGTAPASAP